MNPVKRLLLGLLFWATFPAQPVPLAIDYPLEGSVFPPDFAPPAFVWHGTAQVRLELSFSDGSTALVFPVAGQRLTAGPIDPRVVAETNAPPPLPGEFAWRPDAATWAEIRRHPSARLTLNAGPSSAQLNFSISPDPVGAPIFYRDVPLMPTEVEKGIIQPIVPSAVPYIGWRLRYVNEASTHLLLEGLPTCANCHSFSRDGRTLALDVDGPQNDKGMFAIVDVKPRTSIQTEDVFTWNDFTGKPPGHRTIGFMAQISPDSRHALVTLNEEMFVANFKDYRFLQVFYPTRGILAYRVRASGQIHSLPGADNPSFVQTDGVWTPDAQTVVFARAAARDAYPAGRPLPLYAGDPREPPIQYSLYRVPFNNGKGGRAQPIAGAADNGWSNSFPRVSPDGRWIVYVRSKNGQLMRPDGKLTIVPAAGGTPRLMRCNTDRMNSWHSFSPNGRWMVFSSKSRSPYTQMFLTHLDQDGNDTPPVLIENATAANRAVNLPEFVNVAPGGLEQLLVPAADFYRLVDSAYKLSRAGRQAEAAVQWRQALDLKPEDAKTHNNLGGSLAALGDFEQAERHWRRALEINADFTEARNNLGVALFEKGRYKEAIAQFRRILADHPGVKEALANLLRAEQAERARERQ
jgi:hypothetical protein